MKLSIPFLKVNNNYLIIQSFLILCMGITIFAFATEKYLILLLPILFGFFIVLVFIPDTIPYFLIISNFYGGFIFLRSKIAVTLTDVFFIVVVLAYFGSMFIHSHEKERYLHNNKNLNLLIILFIVSLLSLLVNISNLNTKYILISIWYLIKLVQLHSYSMPQ